VPKKLITDEELKKTKQVGYWLPVELITRVEDAAKKQQRRKSVIVERALRAWFTAHPDGSGE
jgi:hypothetical protein